MRAREFVIESKLTGFKVKNHLTYMPLDQWVAQQSEGEVDEAVGLSAPHRRVPDPELQDYLSRVKNKDKSDKSDYYTKPHVHASSLKYIANGTEIDMDDLRKIITKRPAELLKQNKKMEHSNGTGEVSFNTGLPALKGLAVDEDTGEFIFVDTCPGAGACQSYCYVKGGFYIMFKGPWESMSRTLNFLINDPQGFENQMAAEIEALRAEYEVAPAWQINIRWHDSGDFFSPEYLDLALRMAKRFPTVKFYAYTKMGSVATAQFPDNFIANWSEGAKPEQRKIIKIHQAKTGKQLKKSEVVPKEMFKGLLAKDANKQWQWTSPEVYAKFKASLAQKYNIDPGTILSYDEMEQVPVGTEPKWNVIVKPGGDGDTSANRRDVIGTYLLYH